MDPGADAVYIAASLAEPARLGCCSTASRPPLPLSGPPGWVAEGALITMSHEDAF